MLLIKNGHIKPMVGPELENGAVLIGDDGKITAVGQDLTAPAGTQVIDARRRLVTPGCVDAHCHIGLDNEAIGWEGRDYNEIVDPLTPQMRAIDSIYPQDEAFENALRGGVTLAPTNEYGKTEAKDLDLGLYLVVETAVPEMVVSTTNPFLVSLPMTSVNGTNATDRGTRWIYDVTTFPKNLTGIPSLEKTLRENVDDTGKNGGSTTDITDGYAHTGTASAGDVIDYQVISTLPSITPI